MKICAISDFHGKLPEFEIPECDILLIAGDLCPNYEHSSQNRAVKAECQLRWINKEFNDWIENQPHIPIAICVWGETDCVGELFPDKVNVKKATFLYNNLFFFKGIKIWGSPLTVNTTPKASASFQAEEVMLSEIWNMIPLDVDIILTHTPPKGILDNLTGSDSLKHYLEKTKFFKKITHVFGHCHRSHGSVSFDMVKYLNVSMLNEYNHAIYRAITFNITANLYPYDI